jgi:hypothetical protein
MATPNQVLYYGMENPMAVDPPCTNPQLFPINVWNEWNRIGGEERMAFIEHAELLVDRGYVELTEGRNVMDVALAVFAAKIQNKEAEAKLARETIQTINKAGCTTSTELQTPSTVKSTSDLLPP